MLQFEGNAANASKTISHEAELLLTKWQESPRAVSMGTGGALSRGARSNAPRKLHAKYKHVLFLFFILGIFKRIEFVTSDEVCDTFCNLDIIEKT